MTQLAEIVITTDQATLLGAAADVALRAHEAEEYIQLEDDEKELLQQLVVFMALVAEEPSRFPVMGRMAATLKKQAKALKGPAQRQGGKNKRKARQERRTSFHKRRRKERSATTESFNQARDIMEREMEEAREIQEQRQAEIENEPKFEIVDIMGNVMVSGVPESMIRPIPPEPSDPDEVHTYHAEPVDVPKLIMPGSAEALQTQLDHS